jgi:hypothetical protein
MISVYRFMLESEDYFAQTDSGNIYVTQRELNSKTGNSK